MAEVYSLVYKPEDENSPRSLHAHAARKRAPAGRSRHRRRSQRHRQPESPVERDVLRDAPDLERRRLQDQPRRNGRADRVRGLDINALEAGTRLQLGDSAVIEVIKPRTGCDRFEAIQGQAAQRRCWTARRDGACGYGRRCSRQ